MASPNISAFFRRALVAVGCALAVNLHAIPAGRHILAGHIPPMAARLKPTGTMAETNRLRLALGLPLRNQAELTALLHDLYAPSSERFHQFLKPAEFAARFGPTEEDYAAVTAFARSHGLRVVQTHANRLLLDVEGSVADVQKAFHVNMNVFQHPKENRTFYAPDTEPSVEAGLPLLHVSGLDNYLLPTPNLVVRAGTDRAKPATGSGTGGAFMGRDFRAAYAPGVTLDGAGQTIALVEFDTYFAKDITTYETTSGLPSVPVTAVPVDGFSGPPGGGVTEVSLDIELSISMAPGLSQILVYEAPNSSTSVDNDLLNEMAEDDLANQIACCWLFAIDPTTDLIFSQMAAQGQSFFAASGDYGAYDFDIPLLESDANITLVGGTTLTTTGAAGAWTGETVWNWYTAGESPPSASSGGISSSYAIPYWQQAMDVSSNQASSVWRNVPDVSLTGDNVVLIAQGQVSVGGGTSCATPLWAGFTALINQQASQNGRPPVGFLNPAIYGAAQSSLYASLFHDITNGNNTNYNSTTQFYSAPGYDLCTGWGTPTGQALIDVLAPPDSLAFQPRGGLTFAVANGYPLSIETQTLALKTSENTTIEWAFGPLPKWLGASVSKGAISPSQATFVTLAAAGPATNLPPGNYVTNLLITNLTAGITHLIPVFLQVFDPLLITPDSGMAIIGPVGGPFSETEQDYSLTNFASIPMNWTAQSTSVFADVSPSGGTLQPGDSTNVIVTLDPSASNALISAQSGNLLFTDLNTSYTQSLPFSLTIGNGGFETGDFTDWTFQGGTFPTNFVAGVLGFFGGNLPAADYIHSGAYAAFLGEAGTTGSLSQILPTTAGQLYELSFFLNNPVGGETNQFEVMWDGVALFNQINVPLIEWTNMQFAVAATGASSTLKFVFRNDPDYFGFDDINVTPMPSPTFSSGTISSNSVFISWNAIPGGVYQLEVSTDLSNWIKDGHTITATNSVMTAKENIVHSDVQQYFRLYLLAK